MTKKGLSVGVRFPGGVTEFVSLRSKRSLLDGDLILFRPSLDAFLELEFPNSYYKGKPSLRSKTALVRTVDLFNAAKAVKESGDDSYAALCRRALLEQGGQVVEFPQFNLESNLNETAALEKTDRSNEAGG